MSRAKLGVFVAVLLSFSVPGSTKNTAVSNSPRAEELAVRAFRHPAIPFQARVVLTEWRNGEARAEEVNLFFLPPNLYRMEFLGFDGSVQRVVITDGNRQQVSSVKKDNAPYVRSSLDMERILNNDEEQALLLTNYNVELRGSGVFIGQPVWLLYLTPKTQGKPLQEIKIEQQSLTVLEHRRYLPGDKLGSLTRFATYEPNKQFSSELFVVSAESLPFKTKTDTEGGQAEKKGAVLLKDSYRNIPGGFALKGYRAVLIQGTRANHFRYTDGAIPLSVFETELPVRFPNKSARREKFGDIQLPTTDMLSANQVFYEKRGNHYFTIIGELSPDILNSIANHFE